MTPGKFDNMYYQNLLRGIGPAQHRSEDGRRSAHSAGSAGCMPPNKPAFFDRLLSRNAEAWLVQREDGEEGGGEGQDGDETTFGSIGASFTCHPIMKQRMEKERKKKKLESKLMFSFHINAISKSSCYI
ncbi:hypothetical protein HPP92_009794 [Vanilla planifolia]|uniref:Uncharacterized protein n=1 Tax=Vanilla planifolia TaxID=51239 RepID=A0A835RAY0_VANPL|nr:hypothetical protein HPP92_009794 [Vanilla planifolia]